MGSDSLYHKKRGRKASDLKRKKATRDGQAKILIACEDSKSSAYYFEELIKDLKLTAVHVRGRECGSAPSSVLNDAWQQYEKSKQDRDQYDKIYCVFDRDAHDCFDETMQKIKHLKPDNTFFAITTTPCFEFWLLLHFDYSSKAYQATGKGSACDNVNTDLKLKLNSYGKNLRETYALTKNNLTMAIKNAECLTAENQKDNTINPQTNMHKLVKDLQSIKR